MLSAYVSHTYANVESSRTNPFCRYHLDKIVKLGQWILIYYWVHHFVPTEQAAMTPPILFLFLNNMATSLIHDTVFLNVFELFIYPAFQNTHMQMRIHIHIHIHLSVHIYIHITYMYDATGKVNFREPTSLAWSTGAATSCGSSRWMASGCAALRRKAGRLCGEQRLVRNWGTGDL